VPARLQHAVGDVIADRYEVAAILGRGAFGTVYRCLDKADGNAKAVKEMHVCDPPEAAEQALAGFRREAEVHDHFRGTNIPSAELLEVPGPFTVDRFSGRPADDASSETLTIAARYYLIFHYVDGVSLDNLVQRAVEAGTPLSAEAVLSWTRQVASTLSIMHRAGFVHADVKPANIIVSEQGGAAFLFDLGLARKVRTVPGYGTVPIDPAGAAGTPGFAPPDPVEQEDPTPPSDLYALAMTARCALTGLDPGDPAQLATLAGRGLLELRPDLEAYQAAALDRAIRPAAGERFDSMAAFVAALDAPAPVIHNVSHVAWLELTPAELSSGPLWPGQIKDLTLVIRDRRAGVQPEGQAISEDARLRILTPTVRGGEVVLHLVLKVPRTAVAGRYETTLTIQTADEEHLVPVSYTVDLARPTRGCLLLGLG
jgi:serine/threonine-protein kinase